MDITSICNTINNFFSKIRPPFPQISRLLAVCAAIRRPGLSVINSTANVIKSLNMMGIPTGVMPDGSPNRTVLYVYANMDEIVRMLRKDAVVQCGSQPGTSTSIGYGASSAGPVSVVSYSTTPGISFGLIS